jgi:hypothetical protein
MEAVEHGVGGAVHAETRYRLQQLILQAPLLHSTCTTLHVVRI